MDEVVKIVIMLLGFGFIFLIISNFILGGESGYMDYIYDTSINDTVLDLNLTTNATHNFRLRTGRKIIGEPDLTYITVSVNNTNLTDNAAIKIYLNNSFIYYRVGLIYLGDFIVVNNSVTNYNFTEVVDDLEGILFNDIQLIYVSNLSSPTQTAIKTTIYYSNIDFIGYSEIMYYAVSFLSIILVVLITVSSVKKIIEE